MGRPRRRNAFYHGFQFTPSRKPGKNACPSAEVGLAECTIDEYKFSGIAQPVRTLTKPTIEQMTILRDLGLEGIVSPRHMNPILKSQAYINPDPPADEAKPTV